MGDIEEIKKGISQIQQQQVKTKTLLENVVVNKDLCEKHRAEVYKTLSDCAETQCEKIAKSGRVSKAALVIATTVGGLIGIAIYLLVKMAG